MLLYYIKKYLIPNIIYYNELLAITIFFSKNKVLELRFLRQGKKAMHTFINFNNDIFFKLIFSVKSIKLLLNTILMFIKSFF